MQDKRISKYTKVVRIMFIILLPLLLVLSTLSGDKNYGLLSVIFMIVAMVPFFLKFEKRRPEARELVVIAVMAALAALGRVAFAPIPNFKPTSAIIIISAMAFGPEAGFLTGATAAVASNLFFGQGPWTPWQMFCWGMIGFVAGILRNAGFLKGRLSLSIYGLVAGFAFGWVMNLWFIIGFINPITWQAIVAAYISSFWFDFSNAVSTLIFVFVLAKPWLKKLDRINVKFGLME
ncbi:Substrate-specific component CbrT of predicted cobalamin ECF transporter [Desulfosporosinus sp. I2]|uniref:Substrate-specific component CbrT of predicted cobalamin ECF transporter n=2 Tax=Desulfosporosinus metallidurans TaxID=1888891 RepID=A0A1Q8R0G6_9FIRM|nr:ECF transporter S component [Desulfosporosinus sp. I2]KJR46636.1 Substrate-specific component CbrT of predicted cobalamin ECF transporter [Desulfosporosinus sp. I2]OLN33113.1 Substrate-specific component CbrT of predicted cobalamin ECF transporter [Desulfosporosinus metallidurans]